MTTDKELTPWFPQHIKPVHVGVYIAEFERIRQKTNDWYAYFDGKKWSWMFRSVKEAEKCYLAGNKKEMHSKLAWRGLVKNPSTPKKEQA